MINMQAAGLQNNLQYQNKSFLFTSALFKPDQDEKKKSTASVGSSFAPKDASENLNDRKLRLASSLINVLRDPETSPEEIEKQSKDYTNVILEMGYNVPLWNIGRYIMQKASENMLGVKNIYPDFKVNYNFSPLPADTSADSFDRLLENASRVLNKSWAQPYSIHDLRKDLAHFIRNDSNLKQENGKEMHDYAFATYLMVLMRLSEEKTLGDAKSAIINLATENGITIDDFGKITLRVQYYPLSVPNPKNPSISSGQKNPGAVFPPLRS